LELRISIKRPSTLSQTRNEVPSPDTSVHCRLGRSSIVEEWWYEGNAGRQEEEDEYEGRQEYAYEGRQEDGEEGRQDDA
jgi:hypothetical protein